jgi:hypothetical protein
MTFMVLSSARPSLGNRLLPERVTFAARGDLYYICYKNDLEVQIRVIHKVAEGGIHRYDGYRGGGFIF